MVNRYTKYKYPTLHEERILQNLLPGQVVYATKKTIKLYRRAIKTFRPGMFSVRKTKIGYEIRWSN